MKLEFFAVPDYVCTGVVEHYTKLSVVAFDDSMSIQAICSVIFNKKTQNVQRQARVNKLDAKHVHNAIFGYGKNIVSFCTMDQLANFYPRLEDVEKQALTVCFNEMIDAMNMAKSKLHVLSADWQKMREYYTTLNNLYSKVKNGTYEDIALPAAEDVQKKDEQDEQDTPSAEPTEREEPTITRQTRKMARMVFANGLTEFLSGNVYEMDVDENGDFDVVRSMGHNYYAIRNERGEKRYVDIGRIKVVDQFTEPPRA